MILLSPVVINLILSRDVFGNYIVAELTIKPTSEYSIHAAREFMYNENLSEEVFNPGIANNDVLSGIIRIRFSAASGKRKGR